MSILQKMFVRQESAASDSILNERFEKLGIDFQGLELIPTDVAEEILSATELLYSKFPVLRGVLTRYYVENDDDSIIASTSMRVRNFETICDICFNKEFWTSQKIRKVVKKNNKAGFLYTDNVKGIVIHEIGHVINAILISEKYCDLDIQSFANECFSDWNNDTSITKILKKIMTAHSYSVKDVENEISAYAVTSYGELFAEAFDAYIEDHNNAMAQAFISEEIINL